MEAMAENTTEETYSMGREGLDVETLRRDAIDVLHLYQLGVLTGDWVCLAPSFRWPHIAEFSAARFRLRVLVTGLESPQFFSIEWVRCHLGGTRPWLRCICGSRVSFLYRGLGGYACRKCLGNPRYACQRKSIHNRRFQRACKIRLRLGGVASLNAPFPERSREMRCATYERLRLKVQLLEQSLPSKFRTKCADYRNLVVYLNKSI
jgi:hypothetical protein